MTDTQIAQATTAAQADEVRALFRAFIDWHRVQHAADLALVDRNFDAIAFAHEIAALPGQYAPATGSPLRRAARALRRGLRDEEDVRSTEFRGLGMGRALAERVVADARAAGYTQMRLDTSRRQEAAIGLYEASGFHRVQPYYNVPDDLREWLVLLELQL